MKYPNIQYFAEKIVSNVKDSGPVTQYLLFTQIMSSTGMSLSTSTILFFSSMYLLHDNNETKENSLNYYYYCIFSKPN